MKARPSLHLRLMAILCSAVALAWLTTAAFTYFDTRGLIDSVIDAHLQDSAIVLLETVGNAAADPKPMATDPDRPLSFRILSALRDGQPAGFSDRIEGDRRWRVYAVRGDEGPWIEVAVRQEVREGFAARVAAHVLHPLWLAVPLLAALIWGAVRWGLAPLHRLARAVAGRTPSDTEPLSAVDAPRETLPLVTALNDHFARIATVRERDRRFAADAAHELRTPLAAIRTHAEVALAARYRQERQVALQGVLAGTERATQLVAQLLALARIEAAALAHGRAPVDLVEIMRSVVGDFAAQAAAKGVDLALDPGAATQDGISGHAELLAVLVRNLVDNALRHTPAGGRITLALRRRDGVLVLTVDDTGPGIPPELRHRVRDRFFRSGPSGPGAGLGLSIVDAIAALHAGTVVLSDRPDGPGLQVVIELPDRS
jgi:two-component system sensor histidine kinase QseC